VEEPTSEELKLLIDGGGITTFVCLVGEHHNFFEEEYPQYIPKIIAGTNKQIRVLHFKIRDMDTRSDADTSKLV
jgi:hypothetical protein